MAQYRPKVLQSVVGPSTMAVAFPFKDGITTNSQGTASPETPARYGAYVPSDWAYGSFGPDPLTGVALMQGSY